jgi:aminopeptidase N
MHLNTENVSPSPLHAQRKSGRTSFLGALKREAIVVSLILVWSVSPGVATRHERLIESWKPVHYNVSISLNESLTEISSARVEITIVSLSAALTQIDLDFGNLIVDGVTVDDQTAQFERPEGFLNVRLPKPASTNSRFVVAVNYHGKPKDGLIFTADKSGKAAAIGDNWPNRVHHWIPSLDHPSAKATVHFTVTAPERNVVVANGKLDRAETTSAGNKTWSYSEAAPIPPYCMVIAVGEFAEIKSPEQTVTLLTYYVPSADKNLAVQGFAAAPPSLKFFSETVAPYPYEKLALIVGATRFGGMENSSAIVFSSTLFDPRSQPQRMSSVFNVRQGLVTLVAHEIAHQWFGDSVTESTWSDLWLSEGFATYFAALFLQRYEGEDVFRRYMQDGADAYIRYSKQTRTPLHDTETQDLMDLLNPNNYQKGAWILHMLRVQLGDEAFFRGLRDYYGRHKGGTANSVDLRVALEHSSGKDLKTFFDRWVYSAGHPQYQVSWRWKKTGRRGVTTLSVKQTQSDGLFMLSIPIDIVKADGTQRVIVKPSGRVTELKVTSQRPTELRVDPEGTILNEVISVRERSQIKLAAVE